MKATIIDMAHLLFKFGLIPQWIIWCRWNCAKWMQTWRMLMMDEKWVLGSYHSARRTKSWAWPFNTIWANQPTHSFLVGCLTPWVGVNQAIHWFLGGDGLGIQRRTSVWVNLPKSKPLPPRKSVRVVLPQPIQHLEFVVLDSTMWKHSNANNFEISISGNFSSLGTKDVNSRYGKSNGRKAVQHANNRFACWSQSSIANPLTSGTAAIQILWIGMGKFTGKFHWSISHCYALFQWQF